MIAPRRPPAGVPPRRRARVRPRKSPAATARSGRGLPTAVTSWQSTETGSQGSVTLRPTNVTRAQRCGNTLPTSANCQRSTVNVTLTGSTHQRAAAGQRYRRRSITTPAETNGSAQSEDATTRRPADALPRPSAPVRPWPRHGASNVWADAAGEFRRPCEATDRFR